MDSNAGHGHFTHLYMEPEIKAKHDNIAHLSIDMIEGKDTADKLREAVNAITDPKEFNELFHDFHNDQSGYHFWTEQDTNCQPAVVHADKIPPGGYGNFVWFFFSHKSAEIDLRSNKIYASVFGQPNCKNHQDGFEGAIIGGAL